MHLIDANGVVRVSREAQGEEKHAPDGPPHHGFGDDGDAHRIGIQVRHEDRTAEAKHEDVVASVPNVSANGSYEVCGFEHRIKIIPGVNGEKKGEKNR